MPRRQLKLLNRCRSHLGLSARARMGTPRPLRRTVPLRARLRRLHSNRRSRMHRPQTPHRISNKYWPQASSRVHSKLKCRIPRSKANSMEPLGPRPSTRRRPTRALDRQSRQLIATTAASTTPRASINSTQPSKASSQSSNSNSRLSSSSSSPSTRVPSPAVESLAQILLRSNPSCLMRTPRKRVTLQGRKILFSCRRRSQRMPQFHRRDWRKRHL